MFTQRQGLFSFSSHPSSKQAVGAEEVVRRYSQESCPQLTKGIFHTIWPLIPISIWTMGKAGQGLLLRSWAASIGGWWAVVLSITWLIRVFSPFFSVLVNCLYLKPQILLFFSVLSPIPLRGRVGARELREWLPVESNHNMSALPFKIRHDFIWGGNKWGDKLCPHVLGIGINL